MVKLAEEVPVIDADTHMTERTDLFTERAPKGYEHRVPRVEVVDGQQTWIIDDGVPIGPALGGGVIGRDGKKHPMIESMMAWTIDEINEAAYDPVRRLAMMDELGIQTQVVYPNNIGIGGQSIATAVADPLLRRLTVELYNDAMAEIQESSGNRLLPMPVLPAWSIEDCVREAQRVAGMGFRGVNMTSDPQDSGSPDLANRAWDPLWEVCADLDLPVHFHIGASITAMNFFRGYFWASQDEYVKPAIGGAMIFMSNARVLINTAFAGIFDRYPKLKMVSVESGTGWIPFMLEAMDYELWENAPAQADKLSKLPSQYFTDHWYATLWFEGSRGNLQHLIDQVGEDNLMFETDFPHPTCLFPDPLGEVEDKIGTLRPQTRRKVMGENAAALYRL